MQNIFNFLTKTKKFLKKLLSINQFIKVTYNYLFIDSKFFSRTPRLYYGGSLKGDMGGPLVKIKKLNKFYPEHNWNFNTIYLLSNSIYLNPLSINLIKKKGLPILLNQNGVFYPGWFEGNWEKENNKMSKIYHAADYVLWQSNFCKKASNKFLGVRKGRGEILYNAVDTSLFTPREKNKNTDFTFLITGNIRRKSNYRIFCVLFAMEEVLKENKNIKLVIAGYIEDKNYFYTIIKNLNLTNHILFCEKYSQKDAPKIYQSADAYITMSYQDNCPTAVIEAMSCGLPILYSNSGGVPEIVGGECGLGINVLENWETIQVPDKTNIANGMKEIINSKDNMSQASRDRAVDIFDIKKWINKHKLIFEKLLT